MKYLKLRKNAKGALTVEACISFSFFICLFFLLLFFVKTVCIHMTLDHAVNETAKQIATSAYPVSILNEKEEDFADKIPTAEYWSLKEAAERKIVETVLGSYIQDSFIDKEKITIRYVEFPRSYIEFGT